MADPDPYYTLREHLDAVSSESDRGCVLIAAAWVEDVLGLAVRDEIWGIYGYRAVFPLTADEFDSLSRSLLDGALNKAANRLAFCRAIGLIHKDTARAAGLLFRMRNEYFAHFFGPSKLNDKRVANRLKEFVDSVRKKGMIDAIIARMPASKKYSKARLRFMTAYHCLTSTIMDSIIAQVDWRDIIDKKKLRQAQAKVARAQSQISSERATDSQTI